MCLEYDAVNPRSDNPTAPTAIPVQKVEPAALGTVASRTAISPTPLTDTSDNALLSITPIDIDVPAPVQKVEPYPASQ